jgi:hypothetical protein
LHLRKACKKAAGVESASGMSWEYKGKRAAGKKKILAISVEKTFTICYNGANTKG